MKNSGKLRVLLIACLAHQGMNALSVKDFLPYILLTGVTGYLGYEKYNNGNCKKTDVTPYALAGVALSYGFYRSYTEGRKADIAHEESLSLTKLNTTVEGLVNTYKADFSLVGDDESLSLYRILESYTKLGKSLVELAYKLEQDRKALESARCSLEVQLSRKNEDALDEETDGRVTLLEELKQSAQTTMTYLEKLIAALKQHKDFLELQRELAKADQIFNLQREKKLVEIADDKELFARRIDEYLKAISHDPSNQFPYISYVQCLAARKQFIDNSLKNMRGYATFSFQVPMINSAIEILDLLDKLLALVVNTAMYDQQKREKYTHDKKEENRREKHKRKQMQLEADIRERNARIERDTADAKRRLLEEDNRKNSLAIQMAEQARLRAVQVNWAGAFR